MMSKQVKYFGKQSGLQRDAFTLLEPFIELKSKLHESHFEGHMMSKQELCDSSRAWTLSAGESERSQWPLLVNVLVLPSHFFNSTV